MTDETLARLYETIDNDGRYPLAAYALLDESLKFTVRRVHGEPSEDDPPRHVTGRQLSSGFRDMAMQKWGPLAPLVLRRWGITTSRDVGNMVFVLVEAGFLGKQESDRIEDFNDVFDVDSAFQTDCIPLHAFDAQMAADAGGQPG